MIYHIKIQSYSDVITNSSNEIFVITNASAEIKKLLTELITKEYESDNWGYSGMAGDWDIYTLEDMHTAPREYADMVYFDNTSDEKWAFVSQKIKGKRENGRDKLSFKISEFTLEEFVKIQSLTDEIEYTKDSLFIDVDWANDDFITKLAEKYQLNLILLSN